MHIQLSALSLSIDERAQEMFGVESVWLAYYPNQSSFVVYVIDAQTGAMLRTLRLL